MLTSMLDRNARHAIVRTLGLALGACALCACGSSDDETTPTPTVCGGHGALTAGECACDDGYMQDADDPTMCVVDNLIHGDGVATDVELHLHENDVKIVLATMEVVGEEATVWDLHMGHDDPIDGGPNLHIGEGVTAANMGNSADYHDVTTAPETGYAADDAAAESYVIGSSWRTGGDGTAGWVMSQDVWALKLADETYAKIEVLSAQSGTVHVLCYRQPDFTTDISTDSP